MMLEIIKKFGGKKPHPSRRLDSTDSTRLDSPCIHQWGVCYMIVLSLRLVILQYNRHVVRFLSKTLMYFTADGVRRTDQASADR